MYIFIFLHQTTTFADYHNASWSCISLYSYIKPQLRIKPYRFMRVVYLYIPTSNHNLQIAHLCIAQLYIFIFLHQTTTHYRQSPSKKGCISLYSYIKPQPPPKMAAAPRRCISLYSYIKPQPTCMLIKISSSCISLYSYIKPQHPNESFKIGYSCISLYSYIKPQLPSWLLRCHRVVYLYIPTSNHNLKKRIY